MKMPIKLSSIQNIFKQDREDYRARGDRLRDTRYWAEAAEAYGQHLADHPDDFAIWVQRGNCLKDVGDYSGAVRLTVRRSAVEPGDAECYRQMGHLAKLVATLRMREVTICILSLTLKATWRSRSLSSCQRKALL
jgi:tetratricopeptide (TPR) repeat protein